MLRRIAMKVRRADYRVGALLVPFAVWAGGCQEVEQGPCFGLVLSEPLEIRIVSEYSEAAGYEFALRGNAVAPFCPPSLRLTSGTVLDVQVVAQQDERHQSCDSNTVEVRGGIGLELGAQADWLLFGTEDVSEIVHATQELTLEGCTGRLGISVESRSSHGATGDPFLSAPTGGYPPIILYLGFEADHRETPACSQLLGGEWNCTDYYVVELSRP